jgi:hypothetical protein
MQTASRDLRITGLAPSCAAVNAVAGGIASAVATEVMTILAEIELDAIAEEVFVVLDSYQRAGLLEPVGSFSRWLHVT